MQRSGAIPPRLPSWAKAFLFPLDRSSANGPPDLRYDVWREGSPEAVEGRHRRLPATFRFGPDACKAVTLRPSRALKLTCVLGTLWITRERDTTDYVLSAGQVLRMEGGEALVVFGLRSGTLLVEAAP